MDILIEILLDIYMECMFLIIPEERCSKRRRVLMKGIAILCTLGILALGVWGAVWVFDDKKPWGWLPLGIAILLSVIQITAGIALFIRKNRKTN